MIQGHQLLSEQIWIEQWVVRDIEDELSLETVKNECLYEQFSDQLVIEETRQIVRDAFSDS